MIQTQVLRLRGLHGWHMIQTQVLRLRGLHGWHMIQTQVLRLRGLHGWHMIQTQVLRLRGLDGWHMIQTQVLRLRGLDGWHMIQTQVLRLRGLDGWHMIQTQVLWLSGAQLYDLAVCNSACYHWTSVLLWFDLKYANVFFYITRHIYHRNSMGCLILSHAKTMTYLTCIVNIMVTDYHVDLRSQSVH